MEYSTGLLSTKGIFLAIFTRRWPFHKDTHVEGGKNSFISCKRIGMHKKRENGKRISIWKSISTWTHQRKFSLCVEIVFHRNERQSKFFTFARGACQGIWKSCHRICGSGQGLLEYGKSIQTPESWNNSNGIATTIYSKVGDRRYLSSRAPPKSKSWDRTIDWACKTWRAIRKKQNEKRYDHFGRRVRVYPGVQFATNDPLAAREDESCRIKHDILIQL